MSRKLKILASSALAIPGMSANVLAAGPAESEASYRYTFYQEDASDVARDDSNTSNPRYNIQVHQFHVLHPIDQHLAVNAEVSYEYMAGASAAASYIEAGEDEVSTHYSGASKEKRFDATTSARYYFSEADVGAGAYLSKERDYFALSSNVDGSMQFNNQMTTVSGGISAGYDWLNPNSGVKNSKGETIDIGDLTAAEKATVSPGRLAGYKQNKWQVSVFEGIGQIIDMNTVVQAAVSFTYKNGYLSDPYRDICDYAENVPCDIRPSSRAAGTLALGGRKYFPQYDAYVHADYRLYLDTWDVASHTLDFDVYKTFAPDIKFLTDNNITFQVAPGIRYYQQKSAYFYEVPNLGDFPGGKAYDVNTTEYYSSDPRLSWYGALGLKTRLKITYKQFALVGLVERYAGNPAYGFNFSDNPAIGEVPGLPAYWRFTTGLDFKF
ncbi:DUF3570 domain-containing protein [Reinekea sp.]|jgi:hypothetical protein|uniref:DUF3570 domain-containing protein n=1 Tax=Reinekea sp. TaxID=1970455 RepID=UPI00398A052D